MFKSVFKASICSLLALSMLFASISFAQRETPLYMSPEGCMSYASGVYTFSSYRDQGVPQEVLKEAIGKMDFAYPQIKDMLVHWLSIVYQNKDMGPEALAERFLSLCYNSRGELSKLYKSL